MELLVEVYLNNSKTPAKPSQPVGKGLITVADIIAVEKQDLKCVHTNLEYFAWRYINNIPLILNIMRTYLDLDFIKCVQKIYDLKKIIENAKVDTIKGAKNHHILSNKDNLAKALQMFDDEIKTIILFINFINENSTKIKRYTIKYIKVSYPNKNDLLNYYINIIQNLTKNNEPTVEDTKTTKKAAAFSTSRQSALSSRGTFDSDL